LFELLVSEPGKIERTAIVGDCRTRINLKLLPRSAFRAVCNFPDRSDVTPECESY